MTPDPLAERDLRSALRDHVRDPNVTSATVHALDGDRVRVELDRVAFDMLLRLPDEAGYEEPEPCHETHLADQTPSDLVAEAVRQVLAEAKRTERQAHGLTPKAVEQVAELATFLQAWNDRDEGKAASGD